MPNLPSPPFPARPAIVGPFLAGLVVAIFCVYGRSLTTPFVYDDIPAIPKNPTIRRLWPPGPVLLPQAEGGLTISGRPVLNLSLALNHAISGSAPWSYHVFNILVHAGSALLLFGLVWRTLARPALAAAAGNVAIAPPVGARNPPAIPRSSRNDPVLLAGAIGFLWAAHPLLTQAITYTVQRAESLMGFFYLLTLYAFVRGVTAEGAGSRSASTAWFTISVVACVLGMGTKEVMATAPLIVLLYDRTFVAGTFSGAWQVRWRYYLALGSTWIFLGILVGSTGGNRGGTVGLGTGVPLWAYPLTQFEAVARYLFLAFWPSPLVFEYGTRWVNRAETVLPYATLLLPLLVATASALRHRPIAGFLGASFFVILAPTSLAPGTIQMIVEHRMYLPLIAVVVAAVCATNRWVGRASIPPLLAAGTALGLLTYQRNMDYRTPLALWTDTVAKRPDNPRAHDALAEALEDAGRAADALPHRWKAVQLLPTEATYHYNLASALAKSGRTDEAIRHYERAILLAPEHAHAHNNLAVLLGTSGDHAEAAKHHAAAVRWDPSALFHYNFGIALLRMDRPAEAITQFETALRIDPARVDARFNLATSLLRAGRLADALRHYEASLLLRPDDAEFRVALGNALLLAERPDDALKCFDQVLGSQPDAIEAAYGAGNALSMMRRYEEAAVRYSSVLERTPHHANARFKLANALVKLDRISEAIGHYRKALELTPGDAEGHHNLGIAFARLEKWTDAEREFETAVHLKPDYDEARRNRERIKTILNR